jgi:membrane-associated phospholipid phosphatase
MTRETYIRMTSAARQLIARLPGGKIWLRIPTLVCAAAYLLALLQLMLLRDMRLIRVLLVPAACFAVCTVLRPIIGRQRPYDRFGAEPIGRYKPGKGKSMPSRHTASAAAIALAVAYAFPSAPLIACMAVLCVVIAALRVLCGQHYPSDVLAALLLSSVISLIGYVLI